MRAGLHTSGFSLFLLLLLWLASSGTLAGQEGPDRDPRAEAELKYGPEVHLVNGEKYFYPYPYATGNPFFEADLEQGTSIWIRGKEYSGQHLRYDLYNQQVVLDFPDPARTLPSIVLRNTWVDQFFIGERMFRKYEMEEGEVLFGQVIYQGEISCIYVWRKKYDYKLEYGEKRHEFSDAFIERYLMVDGAYKHFKNKRSFLRCLPESLQAKAKSNLKQHRVRFRKVTEFQLNLVLNHLEHE